MEKMKNMVKLMDLFLALFASLMFIAISCGDGGGGGGGGGGNGNGNTAVNGHSYYAGTTISVSGVLVAINDITYTTGSTGEYLIQNVPAGNQTITATKADFDPFSQTIYVPEEGLTFNIEMTSGVYTHTLDGTVKDSEYAYTISGANIIVLNPDGQESNLVDTTDAIGHYQIPSVPQGTRKVRFSEPDCYVNKEVDIFIANFDKTYNIEMDPLIIFAGTIIDQMESFCIGSPRALTYGGNGIWYSDTSKDKIYKIDPNIGSIIKTLSAPCDWVVGLAWDGNYLWCNCSDGFNVTAFKIDPSNGNIITSISMPDAWNDIAWDGSYLWGAGSSDIFQINPANGNVISTISAPKSPMGLTFDGTYLWVGTSESYTSMPSNIYKLSTSGAVLDSYTVDQCMSTGLAYDGKYLWRKAYYNDLFIYVVEDERKCP